MSLLNEDVTKFLDINFLSLLSALHKALYPHTFLYPDPPSPDPILESGELQSSCSLPMTLICTLLNPLPATCELNPS